MDVLRGLGIAFFLSASQAAYAQNLRMDIVGGHDAKASEFPFIVSLRENNDIFCGGSLVAPDWVLTAAHCTEDLDRSELTLVLGATKTAARGSEVHRAKRVVVHPQYDKRREDYDYALIQLTTPSKKAPVALNTREVAISDDEAKAPMGVIAGWGLTSEGGALPDNLKAAQIPLVSTAKCRDALASVAQITDEMICAGRESGGVDTCQGDSGGPLLTRGTDGGFLLTGVTSFGEGCGNAGSYGVYAKVSAVASWIHDTLREPSSR